eukprot:PhF_6_TR39642/c0_g2_i2/m.58782
MQQPQRFVRIPFLLHHRRIISKHQQQHSLSVPTPPTQLLTQFPNEIRNILFMLDNGTTYLTDGGAAELLRRITWSTSHELFFRHVLILLGECHEFGIEAAHGALVLYLRAFHLNATKDDQRWIVEYTKAVLQYSSNSNHSYHEVEYMLRCISGTFDEDGDVFTPPTFVSVPFLQAVCSVMPHRHIIPLLTVAYTQFYNPTTQSVARKVSEAVISGVVRKTPLSSSPQSLQEYHTCVVYVLRHFHCSYWMDTLRNKILSDTLTNTYYHKKAPPGYFLEVMRVLEDVWPELRPFPIKSLCVAAIQAPLRCHLVPNHQCWVDTAMVGRHLIQSAGPGVESLVEAMKIVVGQGGALVSVTMVAVVGDNSSKQCALQMWRCFWEKMKTLGSVGCEPVLEVVVPPTPQHPQRGWYSENVMWLLQALNEVCGLNTAIEFARHYVRKNTHTITYPPLVKLLSSKQFKTLLPPQPFWWSCGCSSTSSSSAQLNIATSPRCYWCEGYTCTCGRVYSNAAEITNCTSCQRTSSWHVEADRLHMWCCIPCEVVCVGGESCRKCRAKDPNRHVRCRRCGTMSRKDLAWCTTCGELNATTNGSTHYHKRLVDCNLCNNIHPIGTCPVTAATDNKKEEGKNHQDTTLQLVADQSGLRYFTWRCGCGTQNPPWTAGCRGCRSAGNNKMYTCTECKTLCASTLKSCTQCGCDHPRVQARYFARVWWCDMCHKAHDANDDCNTISYPILYSEAPWTCHYCGSDHVLERSSYTHCPSCDTLRPIGFSEHVQWKCNTCKSSKLQRGFRCTTCYAAHPSLLGVHVWSCTACNHRNPSWSPSCSHCSSARINNNYATKTNAETKPSYVYIPWRCTQRSCKSYQPGECGVCSSCTSSYPNYLASRRPKDSIQVFTHSWSEIAVDTYFPKELDVSHDEEDAAWVFFESPDTSLTWDDKARRVLKE